MHTLPPLTPGLFGRLAGLNTNGTIIDTPVATIAKDANAIIAASANKESTPNTPRPSQDFFSKFDTIQPPHPHTNPDAFCRHAQEGSPPMLHLWGRILSWGCWGPIDLKTGKNSSLLKNARPGTIFNFIMKAIDCTFGPEGPGFFPIPPAKGFDSEGLNALSSTRHYNWVTMSGARNSKLTFNKDPNSNYNLPLYPPGWEPKTYCSDPQAQPSTSTPRVGAAGDFGGFLSDFPNNGLPQPTTVDIGGNQWNVVTKRHNNSAKSVSFAQAAASATSKTQTPSSHTGGEGLWKPVNTL